MRNRHPESFHESQRAKLKVNRILGTYLDEGTYNLASMRGDPGSDPGGVGVYRHVFLISGLTQAS